MSPKPTTPRLPFDEVGPAPALPDAVDRAAAVDPARNVVLEASAGTGKTRVLVDRYLNLLQAGVEPRNILAITFTRKAAAEMRERIVSTLRRRADTGEIDPARWRALRDALGEIAISTIDAFCLSLLREFPLEADLEPGFEMADETEVLRFLDEALDRAIVACRSAAHGDAGLELLFAQLGERRLRGGLAVLIERRLVAGDALRRFLGGAPRGLTLDEICARAEDRFRAALASVEGGVEAFLDDGPAGHARFAMLAQDVRRLFEERGPSDRRAPGIQRIRLIVDGLRDHFLSAGDQPRKRWARYSASHARSADAWRRHQHRARAVAPLVADALAAFRRDLNAVLARGVWRAFQIAVDEYRRALERHGVVDFTEALSRTLSLLEQMDEFAQSRYVLEARFQHLLVDEFQDTSQAQWELVWTLVQAWGEGAGLAGEGPLPPSIFVVGDRKQSIYGFRDADVGVLGRAAAAIAGLRPGSDVRRAIRRSFRATPGLLAFTNDLFEAVTKIERRDAFRYGEQDRFPIDAADGDPVVGLACGADLETCAAAIGDEIVRLLQSGSVRDKHTGLARAAEPADVAILFRAREGHQVFEGALEARGVPAYVYKGLGFYDADEVKDVFALLRYLADPASNVRAAAFLRSRFVRLSDPGLQVLATVLVDALQRPVAAEERLDAEDRATLARARASVSEWLAAADRMPPADLLERAIRDSAYLAEIAGPRAAQARENLKKVRALVRRIQNRGYATLGRVAGHLDRLSAGDESNAVIDAAGSVNLMTVHAAKGLEFPIVFLVHLGKGTGGSRPAIRLVADTGDGEPSVSIGDFISAADEDAAARDREETKRLLYVAVTRARDRLYLSAVVGAEGLETARGSLADVLPSSLSAVLSAAGAAAAPQELQWTGASQVHRLLVVRPAEARVRRAAPQAVAAPREDYGAVVDVGSIPRLTATEIAGLDEQGGPADVEARDGEPRNGEHARAVGAIVHAMLQRFAVDPEIDDDQVVALSRDAAASLGPVGASLPALAGAAVARFRAIAGRALVAELLSGGERFVEVPVAWRRAEGIVRGTIDVLVRHDDGRLTVVEFKTGAPLAGHRVQLEAYVEAVRALHAGVAVSGIIVYPEHEEILAAHPPLPDRA